MPNPRRLSPDRHLNPVVLAPQLRFHPQQCLVSVVPHLRSVASRVVPDVRVYGTHLVGRGFPVVATLADLDLVNA